MGVTSKTVEEHCKSITQLLACVIKSMIKSGFFRTILTHLTHFCTLRKTWINSVKADSSGTFQGKLKRSLALSLNITNFTEYFLIRLQYNEF